MADMWMDVDTALASVPVNIMPLLDATDFKTIEDAVAFNASGLALFWNFTTTAGVTTVTAVTPTSGGDYDWTDFTSSGMYGIEIPASGGASINNDTEGVGHFTGVATGVLPWRGPTIGFRAAALNNSLIDAGTTGLLAPATAGRTLIVSAGGAADADMVAISTDATAANNLETMLDGTGGQTLSLGRLVVTNTGAGAAVAITGGSGSGSGLEITGGSTNGSGIVVAGSGAGNGLGITGGSGSGIGIAVGAGAGAIGVFVSGGTTSGKGVQINGVGSGDALELNGGTTGIGLDIRGGSTSGDGVHISATSGDGIDSSGGGAGVGIRADVTGNITGNLSGSVGSVTAPVTVGTNNDKTGYTIANGGIAAASFAAGAIDAAAIAANAIGAAEIANNAITSAKLDATATAAIADAVADEDYDGGVTLRESTRLANSANGAKLSGAATTTVAIRDVADTKDRVTATVDADGNRSAVTLDLT